MNIVSLVKKTTNAIEYKYILSLNKSVYEYIGYTHLDDTRFYELLKVAIESKKSMCIGKIGGSEAFALEAAEFEWKKQEAYSQLCMLSGFFPEKYNEEIYKKYVVEQSKAISSLDVIISYPKKYEMYFLKKLISQKITWCNYITPWLINKQWMTLLSNKNVLVIHPYAELIESQYARRTLVYPDERLLPEFNNLYTIKAVQTIGNNVDSRFNTWMDALDYMEEEARKIDFDVALIGCGAYGLPLAARIKKMGKIGIHCGGELQTYFGIHGQRWDDLYPEEMKKYSNEYWVRGSDSKEIKDLDKVEAGCYL